jgi:hypothetical protein
MADVTHTDLHRDFGRMEGQLSAMDDRLGKIETIVERIDDRLAKIEARESELRGAWWVLAATGTVVGAVIAIVVGHFWK